MTDEEAREDIKTGHGISGWLVEKTLAAYERYRARELSPSKASEQAILYYLASHGAASFDAKTGLYSAI